MTNRSPRPTVHSARAVMALAIAFVLPLQPFSVWAQASQPTAAGQPSQTPLITRAGGQPSPNVMLTLDTSWSMIFPYLPEGEFTVNQKTVKFPGFNSPIMHPDDTRYTKSPPFDNQRPPRPIVPRTDGNGGVIPADLADKSKETGVFQRQMRSPDINKLYYSPRQTYQPWLESKDAVTKKDKRYPAAIPSKAWFDPKKATDAVGYYANLTAAASKISAVWCSANPNDAGGNLACSQGDKSFSPAVYFLLKDGKVDPNLADSYNDYDINNSSTQFVKYENRTDCVADTAKKFCTQAEELQNYANWFVYYRTRLHTAQAAIPEAFLPLDNNKIRVGWGTIHQALHDVDGSNSAIVQSGIREFDSTRKNELEVWIRNFRGSEASVYPASTQPELASRTPLLSALEGVGKYFTRTDGNNPWVANPGLTSAGGLAPLSCRRAYHVLITDGYYTDSSSESNQDNEDGPTIVNHAEVARPASYIYKPANPYKDNKKGTLADIAMKYWKNDLQDGIDNKLSHGNDTPLEDPAFWQHLVQFPIGLGVEGSIPLNQRTQQTADTWWAGDATKAKIDDLLHAAVNSRGQYFSAKNSSELVTALSTALSRTAEIPDVKEGGVGVTTTVLGDPNDTNYVNAKYVPKYTAGSWIGDVEAYSLRATGAVIGTLSAWKASEHVPGHGSRNIVTWEKSVGSTLRGGEGISFKENVVGDDTKNLLTPPPDATVAEFINYIRGDTSKEDTESAVKLFRQRAGKLPDFINSNPVLLKGNVNLRYGELPDGTVGTAGSLNTYNTFVGTMANRPPVLVVGGNGGMLHAFADFTATGVVPGQEIFAYVPRTLLPELNALALRTYGKPGNEHRYYVDGPLVESHAYIDNNWKSLLLGTLGAGGKGIFVLDVTDPTALGPSSVLWERSDADDPEGDIGYMLSAPQVGMLPNKEWVVFVGNGVHSTTGKAVLLQFNLSSGVLWDPLESTCRHASLSIL